MSRSNKRQFVDFDEDPEDDDFDIAETRSPRKRAKKTPTAFSSRPKPQKRRRTYKGSDIEEEDDDILDDSDEVSVEEPSSPIETNPVTGKPTRRTARQSKSYIEPDSDEEQFATPTPPREESEDERTSPHPKRRRVDRPRSRTPSRIVTLKISGARLEAAIQEANTKMERRSGRRSTPGSREPERRLSTAMTRRSSRISHSEDEPLVKLTDSGRHEDVVREGSTPASERPTSRRQGQTRRRPETSTIIEASQEDSGSSRRQEQAEGELTQDNRPSVSPIGEEAEDDEDILQTDVGADTRRTSSTGRVIAESVQDDEDDDDDQPVRPKRRSLRSSNAAVATTETEPRPRAARQRGRRRGTLEEGSDFEPPGEEPEDDAMSSEGSQRAPRQAHESEASSRGRRSGRIRTQRQQRAAVTSENTDGEEDELLEEVRDLKAADRQRRRKRKRSVENISYEAPSRRRTRGVPMSYAIEPSMWPTGEDDDQPVSAVARPMRGGRTTGAYRSLWNTRGPFGNAGGPPLDFRTPGTGGDGRGGDSDSSDDEAVPSAARGIGGNMGMTPTSAPSAPFFGGGNDAAQGAAGGPANLGKIKDRKALADADPLGVDQSVNFDGVGGLESHINQLKEMVLLPLLYPELFSRLHVTPPRGVLFHGPPGTGKTLLARALANSVSSQGQRVTFYMRKGADTLSKYVGEAERQLRLLFEDARKNQPSIIFFDEIDGLAPVRSSKQDQIHATIVTTLLALMDGMDGRGQVIVIGATNRPDTVDSALRRPGRLDREFYFPLPNQDARRAVIDIHTKGWEPPLKPEFKTQLASLTNGYGGADLRALCTEAALNAIQGTYPQIYQSMEKLLVDPTKIKVLAKDFMISVNKIVPSSQRSTTSNASPLEDRVEPLLRKAFKEVSDKLARMLPQRKKLTALEEAAYDDRDDNVGFERELLQQNFDQARVFRPRMLVYGLPGMGQHFIGSALLHKFEKLHVQNFDLSVLYSDTARSPQAAVVQLFTEARRHKPSVIYIPNIDLWYQSLERNVIELFKGSLQALPPSEPVLLLATMDQEKDEADPPMDLLRDLFSFSQEDRYRLERPSEDQRREFFDRVFDLIRRAPTEFPDDANRKKRDLVQLEKAPAAPQTPQKSMGKQELKALKRQDITILNKMKIKLNQIMEQLKREYKGFRRPPIEPEVISYLFDERDPAKMASDVPAEQQDAVERPYKVSKDDKGVDVLEEVATGKLYYNLELVTVEKRLSNGYYKRPKDFLADIKRINKDAKTGGEEEKILRTNIMVTNVSVDIDFLFDQQEPYLTAECEKVYAREQERARIVEEKAKERERHGQEVPRIAPNVPPYVSATTMSTGPIVTGELVPGQPPVPNNAINQFRRVHETPLSNGLSNGVGHSGPESNGVHEDDQQNDDDVQMTNSQEEQNAPPVGNTQSQPLSQRNVMTPMPPGSQAEQYHNSASTTTSGNKTSSKDKTSSNNTQSSNGVRTNYQPDLSYDIPGGSQLQDTQEPSPNSDPANRSDPQHNSNPPSDPASPPFTQPSQEMPPPASRPPRADSSAVAPSKPQPHLILDPPTLTQHLEQIVHNSSGFSVEQLEQMNACLMDTLWLNRGDWNRMQVAQRCLEAFNGKVADIEGMQGVLSQSQSKKSGQDRGGGDGGGFGGRGGEGYGEEGEGGLTP